MRMNDDDGGGGGTAQNKSARSCEDADGEKGFEREGAVSERGWSRFKIYGRVEGASGYVLDTHADADISMVLTTWRVF